MKVIWHLISIQTLLFQACLLTRQNGVENRDKASWSPSIFPRLHILLVPLEKKKCLYWKVSVGLKCVSICNMECWWERLPLYTTVSRNVVSTFEISAVNLIVRWYEFACSMNRYISCLPVSHREKLSSFPYIIVVVVDVVVHNCP